MFGHLQVFLVSLSVLSLSFVFDLAFGEPPLRLHPTVWIGGCAQRLYLAMRGRGLSGRLWGLGYALLVVGIVFLATLLPLFFARLLFFALWLVSSAYALKLSYAVRSLREHVLRVWSALAGGDLVSARLAIQMVVRRPTAGLDEEHVVSAAVETTAESLVDGVTSPLFYYGVFGVVGATCFRAVNTLDSTVGYRTPEFLDFGWASAKLDTYANYLPARITGFLIVLSALFLGYDWRRGLRVMLRDHAKTSSRNAGWPMAAAAGCLRVRLEKVGEYVLGDPLEELTPEKILDGLRLVEVAAALFVALVVLPLLWANTWLAWWLF